MLTETVAIAATPVEGAAVAINGEPVDPGVSWTTPWLQPGAITNFIVEVSGDPGSSYTIGVYRDDVPHTLLPTDADSSRSFGNRVAVSVSEVVVAAPFATSGGAAYVYRSDGRSWPEEARFTGDVVESGTRFGHSLALSDGVIAVGAPADDERREQRRGLRVRARPLWLDTGRAPHGQAIRAQATASATA